MSFVFPTGWTGRAVAVALLLVVALALWLGVASPIVALYQGRADDLVQRRALAAKMTEVAASLPSLQSEAAAQQTSAQPPSLMLGGATDALAAAQLQENLEKAATASGVVLMSAESVPVQPVGSVRRIGLKIQVSGKYSAFVDFMVHVDGALPPLLVDELQMQGTFAEDESDGATVTSLTVYGFRGGEKAS
jgi:general secretion pathway protein M